MGFAAGVALGAAFGRAGGLAPDGAVAFVAAGGVAEAGSEITRTLLITTGVIGTFWCGPRVLLGTATI